MGTKMDLPHQQGGTGFRSRTIGGIGGRGGGRKKNLDDWERDRNALIRFLQSMLAIMKFVIDERIPDEPAALFRECFSDIEDNVHDAISELEKMQSKLDELYKKLQEVGLAQKQLELKLREFEDRGKNSPVGEVFHMGNKILGSLVKVLTMLEPVKEFKDVVESKLKNGGDKKLITILDILQRGYPG
jgi:hypothetical protein